MFTWVSSLVLSNVYTGFFSGFVCTEGRRLSLRSQCYGNELLPGGVRKNLLDVRKVPDVT